MFQCITLWCMFRGGGCAFELFLHCLVKLGANFFVHLMFLMDKITHKQIQNYAQIVPEYINGVETNRCFQTSVRIQLTVLYIVHFQYT